VLREFLQPDGRARTDWREIDSARARFPYPELVQFALKEALGFKSYGPAEKLRWSFPATFRDTPVYFALRKFGFAIGISAAPDVPPRIEDDLLVALRQACRIVSRHLQARAREEISRGNVSIKNRFDDFDRMYRFFREEASKAYREPDAPPTSIRNQEGKVVGASYEMYRGPRHGFYFSKAMLDAYFSRLEHTLVLLLPFVGFNASRESLPSFIAGRWGDKFKRVFDLAHNAQAQSLYEELRSAKEQYRDQLSHGGFERRGASLLVHLPRYGMYPATLPEYKGADMEMFRIHIPEATFEELCALLDRVDAFLKGSETEFGMMFVRSGLNVAFDEDSRNEYLEAMETPEEFTDLISRQAYESERHMNMDY
jgi:hypothetical protein